MCLCVCVCVCYTVACVCVCVVSCMFTCFCVFLCVCVSVCMQSFACAYVCMCSWTYLCVRHSPIRHSMFSKVFTDIALLSSVWEWVVGSLLASCCVTRRLFITRMGFRGQRTRVVSRHSPCVHMNWSPVSWSVLPAHTHTAAGLR